MLDKIVVRGARQHNLKNISLEIPRHKLTVITGLSGSGKSSLAFDTIYAEGQRRYVESLSVYARQFLERMEKPDVDSVGRALSRNQHRTKNHQPKSPFHGRHRYRNLRLHAPAVCLHRQTSLPYLRQADFASNDRSDCGFDSGLPGEHARHHHGARGPRPEGRIQEAL